MFDLIQSYSNLTSSCSINKLGEKILFYLADELKTNILARNAIEVDMVAAFPNICKYLFSKSDPPFIKELLMINDKLERNIFLTNYLKEKKDRNHLIDLNNYAKILTLSYIYNRY